jgi:DNA (cytosine-5)-methyltransferase 1
MRFLSLFAGIGGFDLGLERAGMTCAGQVEIDPFCQRVLAKHWPNVKRMGDIREVKGDEFGTVDLVAGGFPCQPFSFAGKQRGQKDNRYLWPEMLRVIEAIRPRWVLGENVAGIIHMGLDKVLFDLEVQGYACQALIIPACSVGAPHRRDRVWIIGNSNKESKPTMSFHAEVEKPRGAPTVSSQPDGDCRQPDELATSGEDWLSYEPGGVCCSESSRAIWSAECGVSPLDDGVSSKVDPSIGALGNAVVPQVVEALGCAILATESAFKAAESGATSANTGRRPVGTSRRA